MRLPIIFMVLIHLLRSTSIKYAWIPFDVNTRKNGNYTNMGYVKTKAECALHAYKANTIAYVVHKGLDCVLVNEVADVRKKDGTIKGDVYFLDLRSYSHCEDVSNLDLTTLLSAKCEINGVICGQLRDLHDSYKRSNK
ncbi:hypothetical protein QR680_008017 [Steinernema hermaphroditum]|uniref:Peptidase S1 domain-containing protein n=1 Tax=Steinernema hermaphroditum TaxID=289476 RepID=A0AA39M7B7_9BILA|nr:hypothetical protein QR680_008017 [Steinernema hermaphroditum]